MNVYSSSTRALDTTFSDTSVGLFRGSGRLLLAFYLLFRGLQLGARSLAGDWTLYGQEDWASLAVFALAPASICCSFLRRSSRLEPDANMLQNVYGLEVIHWFGPDSEEVALAMPFRFLGELDCRPQLTAV